MNDFKNIIFLDIDGVLNFQLHYESEQFKAYKQLEKDDKDDKDRLKHKLSQISTERVQWLNSLCEETNSVIVVSSTWRLGRTVEELQRLFDAAGGTFRVLDKTGYDPCRVRGVEIQQWLEKNCKKYFGINYYDFYRYAIIDDDNDMLLNQANHFFQTDSFSGLTPNICYRIKKFFTHEAF